MSRNVAIAPSFFAWSFDFNLTIRSPLPSLVTSMVSSPRIDFNSLWILKGDLLATFADLLELITINFLNGDQPAKGDTLIKVGGSSAFFLLAVETAPRAASVQGFFATSGCGKGSDGVSFWISEGGFMIQLQGSPPATEPNQGDTLRHSSAMSGLPWSYTPSRGCGTSTGIDPSPIQRKMTSQLGSVGQWLSLINMPPWPLPSPESGQGGMLMSDSHFCRAVTTSTSRIHPSTHTGLID
ncbi:hypothetical protein PoB_001395600 [Plakobranchus ocellatus]|uniref:Uncharacterized protein n=1 Tax=Plakobranchus ocellatus TaxID=259542 RepID=A0AAV3YVH0_9GAST|nr:hypothetical protein PoB_001395600 [Plakobranchus ocellatus]